MIRRFAWQCVGVAVLLCAAPAAAQQKAPHRNELTAALAQVLDARDFAQPQTLKEFLKRLQDRARVKGGVLPLVVDTEAFKDYMPEGADVWDTPIRLPQPAWGMTASALLGRAVGAIPSGNATYYVRNGIIVVTTTQQAQAASLLTDVVGGKFEARPVGEILQELAAQTGLNLMVDQRIAWRLKAKASADFTVNETALGTALFLLTDMVDVRVALSGSVAYVTSPANARQFPLWIANGQFEASRLRPIATDTKPAME